MFILLSGVVAITDLLYVGQENRPAKHVDLDELYSEIFLTFRFDTLLIDNSLFALGQYFYRFSRVSDLL